MSSYDVTSVEVPCRECGDHFLYEPTGSVIEVWSDDGETLESAICYVCYRLLERQMDAL